MVISKDCKHKYIRNIMTTKKITVKIAAGMGNQMFMYANAYTLSKKYSLNLTVDNTSGFFQKK